MPTHNQYLADQHGNLSPQVLQHLGAFFQIEVHVPPQIAQSIIDAGGLLYLMIDKYMGVWLKVRHGS